MSVFLPKKRKSLCHRIQIPRQLRPYFDDRAEIWRNLETTDKDKVRTRIAHRQLRAQRVFAVFRKHGNHMTQEEREALVDVTHRCSLSSQRIEGNALIQSASGLHGSWIMLTYQIHGWYSIPHDTTWETIDLLDGHRDGLVHEGYAHLDKLPMSLLKEGIELLRYPDVVKALEKPCL